MTKTTGTGPDPADGAPVVPLRLTALVIGDGQEDWMLPDTPFEAVGCRVLRADGFESAMRLCADTPPDLVFMPLTIGGKLTSERLRECLARRPAPVVVVIASNDQINTAADAMRTGAYDCLFKPFSPSRLTRTIQGAIRHVRPPAARFEPSGPAPRRPASGTLSAARPSPPAPAPERAKPAPSPTLGDLGLARRGFVASSPQMQAVMARTAALAASDAPVFLSGEVGTGKNTLARILHELSPRAAMPFVEVNCAALTADGFDAEFNAPHGVLDRASGGTVFLDEVFDLAHEVQPLLLHMIETTRAKAPQGPVRFVAASGRDPRTVLRDGRFRADLYYRLHVAPIMLPPLRARDGDLPLIARTRLAQVSEAEGRGFTGFTDPAMAFLTGYDWPGNLRELVNVIWTVVLMNEGPLVTPDLLPPEIREALPRAPAEGAGSPRHQAHLGMPGAFVRRPGSEAGFSGIVGKTLAEIERAVIEATILAEDGSVPRAARVLDVSPSTLYRKRDAWMKRADE